ncbi:MAG TPA: c-type cytochrome [Ramlibacter sp.]|nr:c-type cytochrome [Ramlibacter sp.]
MMGGGMGSMPMMMGSAIPDTTAAPKPQATRADSAAQCAAVSQDLVNRGRAVFSGAGNCFACHAANGQGTALAPNLTDTLWLNIDGSYASIVGLVRTGVPKPKQYPAPMPPMGGASLSPAQVCAVAAYVYSLSHH